MDIFISELWPRYAPMRNVSLLLCAKPGAVHPWKDLAFKSKREIIMTFSIEMFFLVHENCFFYLWENPEDKYITAESLYICFIHSRVLFEDVNSVSLFPKPQVVCPCGLPPSPLPPTHTGEIAIEGKEIQERTRTKMQYAHRKTGKDKQFCWREWVGKDPKIIRGRELLVLYKSFNTLWDMGPKREKLIVPIWGYIVDFGMGLSYRPASLYVDWRARTRIPMPESTFSPQSGTMNLTSGQSHLFNIWRSSSESQLKPSCVVQ